MKSAYLFLLAQCVLQHHERMDGSSYPYGLSGEQIHPYARWVGMLDSDDARIHPRSYRQATPPHHALEVLYASAGKLYDIHIWSSCSKTLSRTLNIMIHEIGEQLVV